MTRLSLDAVIGGLTFGVLVYGCWMILGIPKQVRKLFAFFIIFATLVIGVIPWSNAIIDLMSGASYQSINAWFFIGYSVLGAFIFVLYALALTLVVHRELTRRGLRR